MILDNLALGVKNISKKLAFDDALLLPKIPSQARFLESFSTDYPFFIQEDFLSPEICDLFYKRLTSTGSLGRVGVSTPEASERFTVKEEFRKTDFFHLSEDESWLYRQAMDVVRPDLESFFNVRLGATEGTQTLGYSPGCMYMLHADDGDPVHDETGAWTGWKITMPNRIISTIFFLTDALEKVERPNQCSGGHVIFEYLKDESGSPFAVVPRKGLFVAFPSTPLFSHRVSEVTDGYRISIVEWYHADLLK